MNLQPPTEHQLLVFWVALLVIIVTARALGALAQRVGQPSVVGELAAGLVLGPSLLGRMAPEVTEWMFPEDAAQTAMLFTVGWLGVLMLLVSAGFETDLGLMRRLGSAATTVSAGSLLVPAAAGIAVGWMIPVTFVGDTSERYVFALFFAAALSISSLPVIAKILSEMGLMRRNFGQLTLAAGMANDVVGWIALGFIAGLAQAGGVALDKLAFTVVGLALFFLLAFTVGQYFVDRSLRRVRARGDDPLAGLTVVLVTALVFGVITQWLHVEAVLGAFIAGVVLARSTFADHALIRPLETMTAAVFAPVFFATAGLRVDLGLLADGETLVWALVVVAAASVSKFVGSLIGARLSALETREGAALGVGLNARGALEIVIATVGLSLGVLNDRSYTVIVLMAMATSMLAPPMLRRVLSGWEGSPDERRRLDLESQLATNTVVTFGRVLIPTRGGISSLIAAQVVALTWPERSEVTLLTVGTDDRSHADLEPFLDVLEGRPVTHQHVRHADVGEAIAAEARLGYDVVVMGAGQGYGGVISPLADRLIMTVGLPVVVVRPPRGSARGLPWAFARAIVPVNGTRAGRAANEIGSYLSSRIGTHLHHLHISAGSEEPSRLESIFGDHSPPARAGRRILDDAAAVTAAAGGRASSILDHAPRAGVRIVDHAAEMNADLIVLSGPSRSAGDHLIVGQTIAHVLEHSSTTLVLALTPEEPLPSTGESRPEVASVH